MSQMIDAKHHFKAVLSQASKASNTCIVDQQMQRQIQVQKLTHTFAYRSQTRQVQRNKDGGYAVRQRLNFVQHSLGARKRSARNDHLVARCGQSYGCNPTNAYVGAGDQGHGVG